MTESCLTVFSMTHYIHPDRGAPHVTRHTYDPTSINPRHSRSKHPILIPKGYFLFSYPRYSPQKKRGKNPPRHITPPIHLLKASSQVPDTLPCFQSSSCLPVPIILTRAQTEKPLRRQLQELEQWRQLKPTSTSQWIPSRGISI